MWRNVTTNSGTDWAAHWQAIPEGSFLSAPSMELSADGLTLTVVALGGDACVWRNRSVDGGRSWNGWDSIGSEFYL